VLIDKKLFRSQMEPPIWTRPRKGYRRWLPKLHSPPTGMRIQREPQAGYGCSSSRRKWKRGRRVEADQFVVRIAAGPGNDSQESAGLKTWLKRSGSANGASVRRRPILSPCATDPSAHQCTPSPHTPRPFRIDGWDAARWRSCRRRTPTSTR